MKIYLDNCCFNRPFDDQTQLRIRLETEAKLAIQASIINRKVDLIWSYILDYENEQNPFTERKNSIREWREQALIIQKENDEIILSAEGYMKKGLKSKDALHVACAVKAKCNYFLTTDDKLINTLSNDTKIKVLNPLTFIQIFEV